MVSIVVCGPESTGKSTLTALLAAHYNTLGLPEYARDYVARLKRPYAINDVETIARRQIAQYARCLRRFSDQKIIFFDTFLIITKVWFQEVYGVCPVWLHEAIKTLSPNLVLLCKPDIDWEFDCVRENGDRRDSLFRCYQEELIRYNIPFRYVEGNGSIRLQNAIDQIDSWFIGELGNVKRKIKY
ncbi:AAA family ATPase [Geofilum sp. OHC36d9]|uniref:AAA family ATPase n=1 Tax=Geofilum sp. OHC36d9 TaxID=3458413 RepID=UPI004033CA0D